MVGHNTTIPPKALQVSDQTVGRIGSGAQSRRTATGETKETYAAIIWLLIAYCTRSASFLAFNISLILYL
jgi:hypothetical protein